MKRRERPEVKKHHCFYIVFWGLKNGQEVVTPFWAPKKHVLKSAKTTILKVVPRKLVPNDETIF